MIDEGARVDDVEVWLAPYDRVRLSELAPQGGRLLLLFYPFDWSST